MRKRAIAVGLAGGVLVATLVSLATAQQRSPQARPDAASEPWMIEQGDWMPLPDVFPRGGFFKVMHGDPARGASDFYFRFPAGYGVPMHFHSPAERVYVDGGTLQVRAFDGTTYLLREGGFTYVPERSPHRATCVSEVECTFYLHSSGPFDIHLVDDAGRVTRSWRPTMSR